jgi:AhpD family alkylhydroperoxidase
LKRLAQALPSNPDKESVALAVRYAENLTRDVRGVSDAAFVQTKARFNDAQLIELTMATCFFNYFARLTAGLGVTPDAWFSSTRPNLPKPSENTLSTARVTLASDEELLMAVSLLERKAKNAATPKSGLGIGIANSQRAMMRVPDIQEAWMGRFSSSGLVPRTTMLQVSLAVSTSNGCRYCVLHQVMGLRRQGVDISTLLALQKDDAALSETEKAAVVFARKLTKTPGSITDADRAALTKAFPEKAAFEVLHQACTFAFMNRFTDGLRLPSEDEAVKIYRETYRTDFPERRYQ